MTDEVAMITIPLPEYNRIKRDRQLDMNDAFEAGRSRGLAGSREIKAHNVELMKAITLHQQRDVRVFEAIEKINDKRSKKMILQAYTGAQQ